MKSKLTKRFVIAALGLCQSAAPADTLVGAINGDLSVDNKGAANYTIPIEVPPGVNGLQPSLALRYESNGGNGVFGMGWGLETGFPKNISRGGTIFAREGRVKGVTLANSDKLYLDGKLLVRQGPNGPLSPDDAYWQVGSQYRTEVDTFIDIQSGGSGSEIQWFSARRKDGLKIHFGAWDEDGNGSFSASELSGYQTAASASLAVKSPLYAIRMVEDTYGNRMVFDYANLGSGGHAEYLLSGIRYGSGATQYSVQFAFEGRGDVQRVFFPNQEFRTARRANFVNVYRNSVLIKEYGLGYDQGTSTNRSRLVSVGCRALSTAGQFDSVPPTILTYTDSTLASMALGTAVVDATNRPIAGGKRFLMDMDGDGRPDLVEVYGHDYNNHARPENNKIYVSILGPNGFGARVLWYSVNTQTKHLGRPIVGDFNGDGKGDIAITTRKPNTNYSQAKQIAESELLVSTGSALTRIAAQGWYLPQTANSTGFEPLTTFKVGDFNGDGRDDIACGYHPKYTNNSNYDFFKVKVLISNGTGFSDPVVSGGGPWLLENFGVDNLAPNEKYALEVKDCNGDGTSDLIIGKGPGWYGMPGPYGGIGQELGGSYEAYLPGADVYVSLSNSTGLTPPALWLECDEITEQDFGGKLNRHFLTGFEDFNGDGKADFFVNSEGTYKVGLSTGIGFEEPAVWLQNGVRPTAYSPMGSWSEDVSTILDFVPMQIWRDFNGDGLVDYILMDLFDDTGVTNQWFSAGPNYSARVRGFAPSSYAKGCYLWLSRGDHFSAPIKILDTNPSEYIPHYGAGKYDFFKLENDLDFNADGILDLLTMTEITAPWNYYTGAKNTKLKYEYSSAELADLLEGVQNGLGATTDIEYGFATDGKTYTRGVPTSYPIRESFSRRRIVSNVYKDTGGLPSRYSYQYSGGRMDLSGRGDLGFHSMVTYDHHSSLLDYQFLSQSFPTTGLVKRRQIYKALNPTFQDGVLKTMDLLPINSQDNDIVFDRVTASGGTDAGSVFSYMPRSRELRWEYSVANPLKLDADDPESLFVEYNSEYTTNRGLAHSEIETRAWYDNQSWSTLPATELPNGTGAYDDPANAPPGAQDGKPVGFTSWLTALGGFSLPGNIVNGNITRTRISYSDGYQSDAYSAFYPSSPATGNRRDLVQWSQVVHTTPGYGTQGSPVKRFSYNANGKPEVEQVDASGSSPQAASVAYANPNLSSSVSHLYFANGCLRKSTFADGSTAALYDIDGGTPATISEVEQLDPTGRFAQVAKNAYGHSAIASFDDYGRKISVNDVNGQAASLAYDGLGRTVQFNDQLRGITTQTAIGLSSGQTGVLGAQTVAVPAALSATGLLQTSVYYVHETASGQPPATTHFDRLGRPIRVIRQGYGGNVTYIDSIYDKTGKVIGLSKPYLQGGTAQWATTAYDELGRVRSVTQPNGTVNTTTYSGRVLRSSLDAPSQSGVDPAPQVSTSLLNVRGETVKVWNPDNQPASFTQTSVTGNASLSFAYDGFGNLRSTVGLQSSTVTAEFDPLGNRILLNDPDTGSSSYVFDARGRLRRQTDANGSVTTNAYDILDRHLDRDVAVSDGSSENTNWFYYDLAANSGLPNVVVDPAQQWIGAVQRQEFFAANAAFPADPLRNYSNSDAFYYDVKGNNYLTLQNLDGKWFYSHSTYDSLNRLASKTHFWRPPGLEYDHTIQPGVWQSYGFVNNYDGESYLTSVTDNAGRTWWTADASAGYDHMDRPVLYQMGGAHWTQKSYDAAQGTLRYIRTGSLGGGSVSGTLQNEEIRYDALGNVTRRSDAIRGTAEDFTYDGVNRLLTATAGATALNYGYQSNGNIQAKDNVENQGGGTFGYHATKIHAVTSAFGYTMAYDANGNVNSRTGNGETWAFSWNGSDKPRWMGRENATNTRGSAFVYGADQMRIANLDFRGFDKHGSSSPSQWSPSEFTDKKIYTRDGSAELEYKKNQANGGWDLSRVRVSVPSPSGSAGTAELNPNSTNPLDQEFLIYHQDSLGGIQAITELSSTALAIDSTGKGSLYSYDPWGSRRDPSDWTGAAENQSSFTRGSDDPATTGLDEDDLIPRGFTGHEMLDDLKLVHMNGRIYDPQIGRFLSADILVQDRFNLQSYNRYSYVLNSPLSYTDPTGYQYHWYEGGWLRQNAYDPVYNGTAAALANPHVQGGLQFVGGVGEAALGATSIAAPEPTMVTKVVGWGLVVHGSDTAATGWNRMIYGDQVTPYTLTNQGLKKGFETLGASPEASQQLADGTEILGSMAGGISASRNLAMQPGNALRQEAVDTVKGNGVKPQQITEASPIPAAAAKRGADWFEDVARNGTKNPDSNKLVLGHFSNEGVSYQKVAAHYNASYLKIDDWKTITQGMSLDEAWKINEAFLMQQVRQGKQILFSHNPLQARAGSFFEREVDFLRDLGYSFRQMNQWTWEAVR